MMRKLTKRGMSMAPQRVRRVARDGRLPTGETLEQTRRRAAKVAEALGRRYPVTRLPLKHQNPLQLLVATILSAQCTDAQVNKVTPALFARYATAADFAMAEMAELESYIKSTGFYHQKARAISQMARTLDERFGGVVPHTMEELPQLHGVGRKTANVILGGVFGQPGMVVDTHVRRISRRWGLTTQDDPVKIEQDLQRLLDPSEWSDFSLRVIHFGREICSAKAPQCPICPLNRLCPSAKFVGNPPWMRAPRASRGARAPARSEERRGTRRAQGKSRSAASGRRTRSRRGPSTPG